MSCKIHFTHIQIFCILIKHFFFEYLLPCPFLLNIIEAPIIINLREINIFFSKDIQIKRIILRRIILSGIKIVNFANVNYNYSQIFHQNNMLKTFALFISFFGMCTIPVFSQSPINVAKLDKQLVQVDSALYASIHEVTNAEYALFWESVKNDPKLSKIAAIDSMGWNNCLKGVDEMAAYHRHKAFLEYPVVNVSYEAAQAYCEWLTKEYNAAPKKKHANVLFRLPNTIEWQNAARGGQEGAMYAWAGVDVTDKKGNYLCNFRDIATTLRVPQSKNDKANQPADHYLVTAPVDAYSPNKFGLYNVCGNASEMVAEKGFAKGGSWYSPREKVQIVQSEYYKKPEPYIGFRIFMETK